MKKSLERREFIGTTSRGCIACIALLSGRGVFARPIRDDDDLIELSERCYCGYICPDDCKLLRGTLENNEELLKEAYKEWEMKERLNVDFDPEVVFCYKCKNPEKPEGIVLKKCTVRKCVMEKELECCIECKELADCDKELWTRFPDFHKSVIELQAKYEESKQ
jgi:hypothetical protein